MYHRFWKKIILHINKSFAVMENGKDGAITYKMYVSFQSKSSPDQSCFTTDSIWKESNICKEYIKVSISV